MKIRIKILLAAIAMLIDATVIYAQNDSIRGFSLEEAQQFAMENSYVLMNSKNDITIAQKQVWEVISTGLPQVSGTANYNMFLNLPVSLLPGEFFGEEPGTYIPVKFGQDYNSDYGITVNQQIFDGTYIVGVGSTQIYLELSKQAHEKAQINIKDAVALAYYSVLIGEENLEVMLDNLENLEQLHNETKIYYDNGFREELDVDQMLMMVRNAENEILKAQREIKVARTVLKYSMGYDLDRPIVLSEPLSEFVNPLIKKNFLPGFDYSSHIDFRMATTNMQVSEKMLKLEKSTYLPRLNAFYSYSKTAYGDQANLFSSDVSWFPSSLIGFQLSLPIFSSGNKIVKIQQAKIEYEKARNQRLLAETTLRKDYLTAVAEMETALEKYENDQENVELAERILSKSKIKFENGIISSTDLSQLDTQYIQAYGAYVASTMQLLQAYQKVKKAAGEI
ncbi:MAG TPA: TolC family protein [Prolixibacteraceae bacterium]|nr:TolC family protein [Prolixibacteraceae bacterium]